MNLSWKSAVALIKNLGGRLVEAEGSRVMFELNKVRAVFHRPHARDEMKLGLVKAIREFLRSAGVVLEKEENEEEEGK